MSMRREKNIDADAGSVRSARKQYYVQLKLGDSRAIKISVGNAQDQGRRPYQEDSFGCSNIIDSAVVSSRGIIAVLSDGMGGLSNGKAVSESVVSSIIAKAADINMSKSIGMQLADMIIAVNESICAQYVQSERSTAGATAVVLYIYKNRIFWATVGDSRLYCIRNHGIYQVNEDHDYMNTLLRKTIDGEGTIEDARNDAQRASLTNFIGKNGIAMIDYSIYGFKIMPGDIYILCSDGIYNGISNEQMMDIAMEYEAQEASEQIVQAVLAANIPGQDNLTAMVIRCEKN